MKTKILLFFSLGLAFLSPSAFAAIDGAAVKALIDGEVTTTITTIGTAMLSLSAVAVGFKWAKASVFG